MARRGSRELRKNGDLFDFLEVKSYTSILKKEKWEKRFVVLFQDELFIFEDQNAKKPLLCLPLHGYNRIRRYESDLFPWSFSIESTACTMESHVFSCSTEEERKMWMRKVKFYMYSANSIQRPITQGFSHFALSSEEEYQDLEEVLFTPVQSGSRLSTFYIAGPNAPKEGEASVNGPGETSVDVSGETSVEVSGEISVALSGETSLNASSKTSVNAKDSGETNYISSKKSKSAKKTDKRLRYSDLGAL